MALYADLQTLSGTLPGWQVRDFWHHYLKSRKAFCPYQWRLDTVKRFLSTTAHMCPQRSGIKGLTPWQFFAHVIGHHGNGFLHEWEEYFGEINLRAIRREFSLAQQHNFAAVREAKGWHV